MRQNRHMADRISEAERELDALAAFLEVWRPGGYAGSLYGRVLRARQSVANVNAAERPHYEERWQRLLAQAGVVVAPSATRQTPIATLKVHATEHDVNFALETVNPRVTARLEAPGAFTLWCDHVPPGSSPPAWIVSEINSSMRYLRIMGIADNYVLLPASDSRAAPSGEM